MEQGKRKADKRDIALKILIFIFGIWIGSLITMVITLHKLKFLL